MKLNKIPRLIIVIFLGWMAHSASGQNDKVLNNQKMDGYKGIWFELGQKSAYGDKYSGGLGTYTAKHTPLAAYAEEVDKTFFVYGGTRQQDEKHLLCMISYYDHKKKRVPKPTVVYDKMGVDDPHDDPSILIDNEGYIWVFVSGRGRGRPGFKYKSIEPYSIEAFEQITEEEMTYPQPWLSDEGKMLHLFTKYTGVRELYYETSSDGENWSEDQKLSGIREPGDERGGHYQTSNKFGNKVGTFFNRHPDGNVDKRTDLYYVQTTDFGETFTTVDGSELSLPLTDVANPARAVDYSSDAGRWKNVYLKDINFDSNGNPYCLYVTSGGHEPGPKNAPREWRLTFWNGERWQTRIICESDHNYDMGSLYITDDTIKVIAPTIDGPQHYGTGGEVAIWYSTDNGMRWKIQKQVTVNSPRNHAYMRRPYQVRDPFYYFWADGNAEEFSISRLYFGDSKGNYWELPYEMEEDYYYPMGEGE